MRYNYRHIKTYESVLEAVADLEGLLGSDEFIDTDDLLKWEANYKDLHGTCLLDRYFNSCFVNLPCDHTKNNIEYSFSMLFYEVSTICAWVRLNSKAKHLLPKMLATSPKSNDELELLEEVYNIIGNYKYQIRELEVHNEAIQIQLDSMNFGNFFIRSCELKELYQLSKLIEL